MIPGYGWGYPYYSRWYSPWYYSRWYSPWYYGWHSPWYSPGTIPHSTILGIMVTADGTVVDITGIPRRILLGVELKPFRQEQRCLQDKFGQPLWQVILASG